VDLLDLFTGSSRSVLPRARCAAADIRNRHTAPCSASTTVATGRPPGVREVADRRPGTFGQTSLPGRRGAPSARPPPSPARARGGPSRRHPPPGPPRSPRRSILAHGASTGDASTPIRARRSTVTRTCQNLFKWNAVGWGPVVPPALDPAGAGEAPADPGPGPTGDFRRKMGRFMTSCRSASARPLRWPPSSRRCEARGHRRALVCLPPGGHPTSRSRATSTTAGSGKPCSPCRRASKRAPLATSTTRSFRGQASIGYRPSAPGARCSCRLVLQDERRHAPGWNRGRPGPERRFRGLQGVGSPSWATATTSRRTSRSSPTWAWPRDCASVSELPSTFSVPRRRRGAGATCPSTTAPRRRLRRGLRLLLRSLRERGLGVRGRPALPDGP